MATGHTRAAVAFYRVIESDLAALVRMLEQTDLQNADQLTVTTLQGVAKRLDELEGQWNEALWIAEAERKQVDAQDEAGTQRCALGVGVQ